MAHKADCPKILDHNEALRRIAIREDKEREKLVKQELIQIAAEREAENLKGHQPNGVPNGLKQCPECGEWCGRCCNRFGVVTTVSCICAGVVCPDCGERYHRPVSNYYNEHDKVIWHVPYFGGMAHTSRCKGRKR
jgi:hypothetical protein